MSASKNGNTKLFGTDGIRGTANQYPMTGELIMQVSATAFISGTSTRENPVALLRHHFPVVVVRKS